LSAAIANEKKAEETIILNISSFSSVSDYVIICSGTSDRQVKAIADSVVKNLKKFKIRPLSVEGYSEGKWVLLDFNDFIVHIFYEPVRSYYRLEELWPEAEEITIPKNYLDGFEKIER
jgi:ribosome-associated protein